MISQNSRLEIKGITKSFPGTKALDNIDLTLKKGEILGLIGENGAGKSTLVKILCGAYKEDEGEITINGEKVEIVNTEQAQKLGISVIYQELSLLPHLSVYENIFIHRELLKGRNGGTLFSRLNDAEMRNKAKNVLSQLLSTEIDINTPVSKLSLAEKQIIEISRALCFKANIIIMDEPTEALRHDERERLFEIMNKLKESGCSIILVSHLLDEILRVCDRVIILRDGKNVGIMKVRDLDTNKIIKLMIGRNLDQAYPHKDITIGKEILKVKNLCKKGKYNNISFTLHEGEVLGIAGVEGSGKNELIRSLFGLVNYDEGEIIFKGKKINIKDIRKARENKFAFMPADRKKEGLFLEHDIIWNSTIANINKFTKVIINSRKEKYSTLQYIDYLKIKAYSPHQKVNNLSGGNQQKVMFARWLMTEPDVLLLEDSTRGIDVNTKTEIYKLLMQYTNQKKGIILTSTERQELLGVCDRIIVLFKGEIIITLNSSETDEELLLAYSRAGGLGNQI
jgi:ABC-type sugar transport system ATPase subunit